jgi:hypothetical protein
MKVKNIGKRDIVLKGNLIPSGQVVEVENVKQSDLIGSTLEVIKEPKKDKETK